jgi:predicted anti-sigma-YlaC factor YlaD
MEIRPAKCERAAQFVSLDLDGELSRFERAILTSHLRRCASCAEHARSVTAATTLVRATPLEAIRLSSLPQGRRWIRHAAPTAMATAAVAMAALWVGFGFLHGGSTGRPEAHAPKLPPAVNSAAGDRFDWPAGVPRGQQVVQFVPGGRFSFNA